jgi:hypothetical protein
MDDGLRQVLQNPAIKHSLSKLDISNCRSITSAGLVIPPLVRATACQHSIAWHSAGQHALNGTGTDQAYWCCVHASQAASALGVHMG